MGKWGGFYLRLSVVMGIVAFATQGLAAVLEVCPSGCAYSAIQAAISAASAGDTIQVGDGTYYENLNFLGKAITLRSVNGQDRAIIDGGGTNSVVTFNTGEGPLAILEGFSIQNGNATYGGGINAGQTSPTIRDCLITNNSAAIGAGIYLANGATPTITNCLINHNQASISGGGISVNAADAAPTITNCTITGNSAPGTGAGLRSAGLPTIVNTIIWGNSDPGAPTDLYSSGGAIDITYSNVAGGWTGTGNIDCDPAFLGFDDYHLSPSSCSRDAGTAAGAPLTDFEGDPRPLESAIDLGADEYKAQTGYVVLDLKTYTLNTDVNILVMDSDLNTNPLTAEQYLDLITLSTTGGDSETTVTMTETGNDTGIFSGTVATDSSAVAAQDGTIQISCGTADILTARYADAENGSGSPATPTDTATSDCFGPLITNVASSALAYNKTAITWDTDELSDSCVSYGPSLPLAYTECDSSLTSSHSITLTDLALDTTFLFSVRSTDAFANQTVDDNAGASYQFHTYTPQIFYIPDYGTIQSAINAAIDGDIIMLRDGTYYENISFAGKAVTVTSEHGPATAIINGGGADSVVRFATNERAGSVLQNVTITNGNTSYYGGGIYIYRTEPTITNCIITNNSAATGGGGISIDDVGRDFYSPTISNCLITNNNSSAPGGGVYCRLTTAKLTNNIISGNIAGSNGGGIFATNADLTVTNTIFDGNTANTSGGGFYGYLFPGETNRSYIANCTFSGNHAAGGGGGIKTSGDLLQVRNTILWANSSTSGNDEVDGIYSEGITYSLIQGGRSGTGNISSNPLFAGGGDYHLSAGSPAINAGTSDLGAYPYLPATDIEGTVRICNDMGAYESANPDTDGDGVIDCLELCPNDPDKTAPGVCGCNVVEDTTDTDNDSYYDCIDCAITDPAINPGAAEVCGDGIDNNCDQATDDDGLGSSLWYADTDSDTFGDPNSTPQSACTQPSLSTLDNTDCNDTVFSINPGAPEICDAIDNNCDSAIDEGFDVDGDGFTSCGGDCNDNEPAINPTADDSCDGIDNDCNGTIDDGFDTDYDGFSSCNGDCNDSLNAINPNAVEGCTDGIDNNCDGQIDDCLLFQIQGTVDMINNFNQPATPQQNPYGLMLGDQFAGSYLIPKELLQTPGNYWVENNDIALQFMRQTGAPLQVDNSAPGWHFYVVGNYDGLTYDLAFPGLLFEPPFQNHFWETQFQGLPMPGMFPLGTGHVNWFEAGGYPQGETEPAGELALLIHDLTLISGGEHYDFDGDGYSQQLGDCDDTDPARSPGEAEICDQIDNNCDGQVDEGLSFDLDGDGHSALASCAGTKDDCNDNDPAIYPGNLEICDGKDNNCDSQIDEGLTADIDGDGYTAVGSCQGSGDDCNDAEALVYSGNSELCQDNLDNNCNGLVDEECLPVCTPELTQIASGYQATANDSGEIVYTNFDGSYYQLYSTSRGPLTSDPVDKLMPSINNQGEVVWLQRDGAYTHVFGLLGGASQPEKLSTDQAEHFRPVINELGQIAWSQRPDGGNERVMLKDGASLTQLSEPGVEAWGVSINNLGDAVWVQFGTTHLQVFRMTAPGAPAAQLTFGDSHTKPAINDWGEVIWVTSDEAGGPDTIQSSHRGLLVGGCEDLSELTPPDLSNNGNLVFGGGPLGGPYTIYRYTAADYSVATVPAGLDVDSSPEPAVTVTFPEVITEGLLSSQQLTNSSLPANFLLAPGAAYNLEFNGSFTGQLSVCFRYDETGVANENNLQLLHWENMLWQDITNSLDPVTNTICGESSSFSPFIVAEPCPEADGDGICDLTDNCPNHYNPGQEDMDGDNVGDLCDTTYPDISAAPSPYDFGITAIGNPINQLFTVTNNGNSELSVAAVEVFADLEVCQVVGCPVNDAAAFVINSENCVGNTVPAAATCTVEIWFAPYSATEGAKVARLAISSNDPDTPVLNINLEGLDGSDTDGDGVRDRDDNCPLSQNANQADQDGDGFGDPCDSCAGNDASGDSDADGVCDDSDQCPGFNDSADADQDGVPDACDLCAGDDASGDPDGDGFCTDIDSCPGGDDNIDTDGDLVPDFCDAFPNEIREWADFDGDGIGDNADLCLSGDDTIDTDADTVPDACDEMPFSADEWKDTDGDGLGDNLDNCIKIANPAVGGVQDDEDNDAIGDACDPEPQPNYGSVLDAPHNESRGISCRHCHSYSVWWQYSPANSLSAAYGRRTDAICLKCHGSGMGAINAVHSSGAMNFMHNEDHGDWSAKCVDCHNPHEQEQVTEWNTPTDADSLYLVTGKFGAVFTVNNGQTTFDYTDIFANNPAWAAPATWSRKDPELSPPSGLILVQDTANAGNTFEVIAADESTITIRGGIDQSAAAGGTFGLVYGRLLKARLQTPYSGTRLVKYFDSVIDSYKNNDNSGLCQVCHDSTLYWTNTGAGAGHYAQTKCTDCHQHRQGFRSSYVDNEPPVITLNGPQNDVVECGSTYADPGATVQDNSSVNLGISVTGTVAVFEPGSVSTLFYTAEDNAGNTVQLPRNVMVQDTVIPLLVLNGASTVNLPYGEPYVEEGVTLTDSCGTTGPAVWIGGDLVDSSTPGTYTVTYNGMDAVGNPALEIVRTVIVAPSSTDHSADLATCTSNCHFSYQGGPSTIIDAPHNQTNGIGCNFCHNNLFWWQFSPVSGNPNEESIVNAVCLSCHGPGGTAIQCQPHSAAALGSIDYGDWSTKCNDCHDPHFQQQLDWNFSSPSGLYLVTGIIDSVTINGGSTEIAYSGAVTNNPYWDNPATWSDKTVGGAGNCGLILVVDTANTENTYQVMNATAANITLKGEVSANDAGKSFGLIYGQLIRSAIATPASGTKQVKFFDPNSGYAEGSSVDDQIPRSGICQVCHTKTALYTEDGLNDVHYATSNCFVCHQMAAGFAPALPLP